MAWLQNLAGKAEDLLVKFDQNAATVLKEPISKQSLSTECNKNSNVIELFQDNDMVGQLSMSNVAAQVGDLNLNLCLDSYKANILIINERSEVTENELDGVISTGNAIHSKQETPSLTSNSGIMDNALKRDPKTDYSCVSSKSSSLQNSFILMDDTLTKYEEKITKLTQENEDLNQQLINIHHLYSELENENSNTQSQLERANKLLAATQNEMEQYRARAQRILQEKERLIELKENNYGMDIGSDNQIVLTYNEELKKELHFQEQKYNELSLKLQSANTELSALHRNFAVTQKESQTSKQVLQDTLINERKVRAAIEEECRLKTKDLQSTLYELSNQNDMIADKSRHIFQLQDQLKRRTHSMVNQDLELHIKSLTQTLMSKQNSLETVTTDSNALRLQLEKLENENLQLIAQMQNNQVKSLNLIEADEVIRSQVPQFMKISPFDVGVARRVKNAYSCLDTVSIRTGVFLRRYPFARVFVFCYMVLLHLWVLIILCTYIPTSH